MVKKKDKRIGRENFFLLLYWHSLHKAKVESELYICLFSSSFVESELHIFA